MNERTTDATPLCDECLEILETPRTLGLRRLCPACYVDACDDLWDTYDPDTRITATDQALQDYLTDATAWGSHRRSKAV